MDWQPIETAPEKKWVLLACPADQIDRIDEPIYPDGYCQFFVAQLLFGEWQGPYSDGWLAKVPWDHPPTHWASLSPPSTKE